MMINFYLSHIFPSENINITLIRLSKKTKQHICLIYWGRHQLFCEFKERGMMKICETL